MPHRWPSAWSSRTQTTTTPSCSGPGWRPRSRGWRTASAEGRLDLRTPLGDAWRGGDAGSEAHVETATIEATAVATTVVTAVAAGPAVTAAFVTAAVCAVA